MDKTCLVTGVTGGIGRALAHVFSEAGYLVIGTGRSENPPGAYCDKYIPVDLELYSENEEYASSKNLLFHEAIQGRLNVLINNAAIQILGGAESLTRKDWNTTIGVNLIAPFLLLQSFLTALEATQGCVVNIGSIHARLTKRNFVAYATSKAALAGLTRALAVDLGPRIRINTIEPAAINTDMLQAGFAEKKELFMELEACHPQQRIGTPEEVAHLALAIAEGGMAFLHGSCIGLDGGIGSKLFDPD